MARLDMKQTFVFLTCICVTLCGFNFEAVAADLDVKYIKKCNGECSHCHAPIKCNDNQIKCGEMPPKDCPDCLPDEICVPMDCFCKYRNQSNDIQIRNMAITFIAPIDHLIEVR